MVTAEADTVVGRMRRVSGEYRVNYAAVPSSLISVERREEKGGGMLIGAAAGFIAGAIVAAGMAANSETASDTDLMAAAAGGGGAGAFVGLVLGNFVAPARVVWRKVWPDS